MGRQAPAKRKPATSQEGTPSKKQPYNKTASPSAPSTKQADDEQGKFRARLSSHTEYVTVVGEALLTVESGTARLFGGDVTAASGPCKVAVDPAMGLPLVIQQAPVSGPDSMYVLPQELSLRLDPLPAAERLGDSKSASGFEARQSVRDPDGAHADAVATVVDDVSGGLPPLWLQTAEEVAAMMGPEDAVVVVGAKKVGKSTLARLLTNVLLRDRERVAFLETDCGQVEFGVPGVLSLATVCSPLTGSPQLLAHEGVAAVTACRFVGDVSPASDSARYVRSVAELNALRPPGAPLVVNTHGWTRGVGQDTLAAVLGEVCPRCVVQVSCGEARKDLPDGDWWVRYTPGTALSKGSPETAERLDAPEEAQTHCWLLPPLAGDTRQGRGPSSVELRAVQWTSWARRCALAMGGGGKGAKRVPAADLLASAVPYEAPWDAVAVESLFSRPLTPDQMASALNAAVVGLCRRGTGAESEGREPACLGVGVVRAVDGQRRTLLLLTDLDAETLAEVDVLQLGRLELPGTLLQSAAFRSPYMALHCMPTMGTGSGQSKSRNNLPRTSQLNQGGAGTW